MTRFKTSLSKPTTVFCALALVAALSLAFGPNLEANQESQAEAPQTQALQLQATDLNLATFPLDPPAFVAASQAAPSGSQCRFNCLDSKGNIVHDGVLSCPHLTPDECKEIMLKNPSPCPKGTKLQVVCYPV